MAFLTVETVPPIVLNHNPLETTRNVRLAIVANAPSPYRIHQHRRIVSELENVQLVSLFLQQHNWQPWQHKLPPEIHPVFFALRRPGEAHKSHGWRDSRWDLGGRVCRWLLQHRPDAVILTGYNDLAKLRIIHWCHRHRVPLFIFGDSNIRGDRARGLRAFMKRRLVRWAIKRARGVMSCGSLGASYFARYGASPDSTFFVPHEPDYQLIQELPASRIEAVRKKFKLPPGRHRMVFCGRLVPVKRVDLLLAAFAQIAPERADWDLVLVGDGPLASQLRQLVPPGLRERVYWLGFLDRPDDIAAIYRNCEVFVLPSDYEPWAVVVCEAAAAGLALVASDVVGAAAELVEDGQNGRIFPAGNGAALAECLLDVTKQQHLESMKAATPTVLARWRQRGDPVKGICEALQFVGLAVHCPPSPPPTPDPPDAST